MGTSYSGMRAIVTETTLQLWRLGAGGPEVFTEWLITGDITGKASIGFDIPTAAGVARIEQGGGCGCGNKLAHADLFPGTQTVLVGIR